MKYTIMILITTLGLGVLHCGSKKETQAELGPRQKVTYLNAYNGKKSMYQGDTIGGWYKTTIKKRVPCKFYTEINKDNVVNKLCFVTNEGLYKEIIMSDVTAINIWEEWQ